MIPLNGAFAATVDGQDYPPGRPGQRLQRPQRCALHRNGQGGNHHFVRRRTGRRRHRPGQSLLPDPPRSRPPRRRWNCAEPGNCSRQVHNFGTPAALEADRFIVCEVLTPAGNWSSYPPHKHDEEKDGETSLEEIYYFETRVAARGAGRARARTTPSATSASTPPTSGPSTSRPRSGPATSSWCPTAGTAPPWPPPATTCTTSTSWPAPARSATGSSAMTRTTAGSARPGRARTWTRGCRSGRRRRTAGLCLQRAIGLARG